jgi:RNA polymerase subunit RPABC4/transcription elongation factor Spt4
MADYSQKVTSSFNERVRLIRVRRKKENLRFWDEFLIIPRWLMILVGILYLIALGIAIPVNLAQRYNPYGNDMFPPDLRDNPVLASFALAGAVTFVSFFMAIMIFMIAYVNRDAARRGMNSALWTLLVLVLTPSSLIIGFVIYFLMREPLPYPCPQCSASVSARFNFCPNCKCNLQPACPQCKREVAELDKFCPYCGNDLASTATTGSAPQIQTSAS